MSATLHRKRLGLRIGTALASGIIGIVATPAAQAQTIPDIPNNTFPTIGGAGTTADNAQITTVGTTMTVNLTSSVANGSVTDNRNIVWSNYRIGANNTVSYVSDVDTNPLVALNRVTSSANISIIEGSITAESHIAVWLINPQGMMFANGSSFSGGSLILTTLTPRAAGDITNILDGTGAVELGLSNGSSTDLTAPIVFAPTASISSSGRVGLIAQQIEMNGTITATGDAGLVLAQGITMASSTASPLSYVIDGGTKLNGSPSGEATAQLKVGGTITAANVKLYAVSDRIRKRWRHRTGRERYRGQ
jgi:filamentous hemagglutinin family protein